MTYVPPKRSIWLCNCDTEGRKNFCKNRCHNNIQKISDSPKHWFVVISEKNDQNFVTALPFTSNPAQESRNLGIAISSDDVTTFSNSKNTFTPKKLTLALCNKVCRIPREDLIKDQDFGMVTKDKFNEIVWEIKNFIKVA